MADQADETQRGLTAATALAALGLEGGGLPEDEAAAIAAGSRRVDLDRVREALRPYVHCYVIATKLARELVDRRALTAPEVQFLRSLDGARTVRSVIDGGGLEQEAAARLIWALASGGAMSLTIEPPAVSAAARRVADARAHIQARWRRLWGGRPNHYDVLELRPEASALEIDAAVRLLGARFAPEGIAGLDLGELAGLVRPMWDQILRARQALLGGSRHQYDASLTADPSTQAARMRRKIDEADAEGAFVRGQRALAAGDVFKAVSELAAAARRLPEEPDYEVYAAWARVLADDSRGSQKSTAALRERQVAEQALRGRRPRKRALYALSLICEAAGDPEGAREALRGALACDPRFAPARQALDRLGS